MWLAAVALGSAVLVFPLRPESGRARRSAALPANDRSDHEHPGGWVLGRHGRWRPSTGSTCSPPVLAGDISPSV